MKKYLFWQERVGNAALLLNITHISASVYQQTHFQQSELFNSYQYVFCKRDRSFTKLSMHISTLVFHWRNHSGEWLFYCFALFTQKVGTFDWFVSFSCRTFVCKGLKTETLKHRLERQQLNIYFIQSFTVFSIGKICSHS